MAKTKSKKKEGRADDASSATGRQDGSPRHHADDDQAQSSEDESNKTQRIQTLEEMKRNAFNKMLHKVVGLNSDAKKDFIKESGCEMMEHVFDIDSDSITSIVSESDHLTARHGMALKALYIFVEREMNAGRTPLAFEFTDDVKREMIKKIRERSTKSTTSRSTDTKLTIPTFNGKSEQWKTAKSRFKVYLESLLNPEGVPLTYILRDCEVQSLHPGEMQNKINDAPHEGPQFVNDNHQVLQLIKTWVATTPISVQLKHRTRHMTPGPPSATTLKEMTPRLPPYKTQNSTLEHQFGTATKDTTSSPTMASNTYVAMKSWLARLNQYPLPNKFVHICRTLNLEEIATLRWLRLSLLPKLLLRQIPICPQTSSKHL